MRWLGSIPYRAWLLVALIGCHAVSAINPTDYQDFIFEHIPTVVFLIFIVAYERISAHGPLTNWSYTLLFVFLLLHIVGAHYLYSNVPYDAWSESIFGSSISDLFGWDRNHYDRLVHLMFGALMVRPLDELIARYVSTGVVIRLILVILVVTFLGQVYEWLEWGLTMTVSPEAAENYNGQQGDIWDPHKDTLLALAGAVMVGIVFYGLHARREAT